MKILITGGSGFVGYHLIEELLKRDHKVYAGYRSFPVNLPVKSVKFDISSISNIKNVLLNIKPDVIFHLAAQSNVPTSWDDPAETVSTNTIGSINLVKTAGEIVPESKIITVGSSEEYGLSALDYELLSEEVICNPQNPYASSKYFSNQLTTQLAKKYKLKLLHLRPFNHFGPGQKRGFVVSDFASSIAEIELGKREPVINVGDLSSFRDFTDVRDIVKAYCLLIESDITSGIFNVSSGRPTQIKYILEYLIGLSDKEITVKIDKEKYRPSNIKKFGGDATKLKLATDWVPQYDIRNSLEDTLNWWRSQVK
jgi:GDP-4-dehydro-6-deoxy-D-mannose reductase